MAGIKKLEPGKTATLRIPKDIDLEVLDFINAQSPRHKYLIDTILKDAEEKLRGQSNVLSIALPPSISKEQKIGLEKYFAKMVNLFAGEIEGNEEESVDIDMSMYENLIEDDDE